MVKKASKQKYKRAPGAPKRFKSAFMFFSEHQHKVIRDNSSNKKIRAADVAKVVSQSWKNLDDTERMKWLEMAKRDRERFDREKAAYKGPWKVPDIKDPSAPKKPMSAFLAFGNERRRAISDANPTLSNTEISHLLSKLWKESPDNIRQQYRDREAKEREAFKKVRLEWEQRKKRAQSSQHSASLDEQQDGGETVSVLSLPQAPMPSFPRHAPIVHPITAFSADSESARGAIQPLRPDSLAGLYAGATHASIDPSAASGLTMVSDGSIGNYFVSNESSLSSLALFDPAPLPSPCIAMTRESTSTLEEDAMSMEDFLEDLAILGEMEVDDDAPSSPNSCLSDQLHERLARQQQHNHQSEPTSVAQVDYGEMQQSDQQNTAASFGAQETLRLSQLAQKMGDANVSMFIGAFR